MSEQIIASLQRRIDELTGENAQLKSEAKDRRLKGKKLREEHESLRGSLQALEAERDRWKAQAESTPNELQARVDELTGQLRDVTHKAAFAKKAEAHKVRPNAVEALWTLAGYRADADAVDESKLEQLMVDARTSHPYLFDEERDAGVTPGPTPGGVQRPSAPLTGAVGGGRGAPDTSHGRFAVRRADVEDPAWMRANQAKIAQARKAGSLVFID
jgi:FtsZ-binding cell division protein ZapB